jgi:peptidoglycan/xylan/chitin deacetylase (PgdA/CDA1 family)
LIKDRVSRKTSRIHSKRSVVSICFDDFPGSAATTGREVIETAGARASYYVACALTKETPGNPEDITPETVKHLIDAGHEIGCHTYSHTPVNQIPNRTLGKEIQQNQAWIEQLVPGYRMRTFAYPHGIVTMRAKRLLGRSFACARATHPGLHVGKVDLNQVRANKIYSQRRDIPALLRLIEQNREQGGWLVFYTHDVAEMPSAFGCRPDELTAVVEAAARHCEILTMRDAISELGLA